MRGAVRPALLSALGGGGSSSFSLDDITLAFRGDPTIAASYLNNSDTQATDGQGVKSWVGGANTITEATAGDRPPLNIDGGPNGGRALEFSAHKLATAVSSIAEPWAVVVWKPSLTGTGMVIDESATSRVFYQRSGNSTSGMNAGSAVNGITITPNEWNLTFIDWGAGRANNNCGLDIVGDAGSNPMTAFVLGNDYQKTGPLNALVADVLLGDGAVTPLTDALRVSIAKHLRSKCALTSIPSATSFFDTFTRANGASIGTAESGHGYEVGGSGTANLLIVGNALSHSGGTIYVHPKVIFPPNNQAVDYSTRALGGGDVAGGYIFGLATQPGNTLQALDSLVHLGGSSAEAILTHFTPGGSTSIWSHTYATAQPTGRATMTYDRDAGTIRITCPDGHEATVDWDSLAPVPLSAFIYPFFELLAGVAPVSVIALDSIEASY